MRHAPGLAARLDLSLDGRAETIATDATWLAGTHTRFGPSPISWSSIPDRIDARRDTGDWTLAQFDDSGWEKAAPADGSLWGPYRARSIPLLRETEVGPLMLVEDSGRRPRADALPVELTAGKELVIDAGRFVQAYTVLDVEADAGSLLEMEHAQRYFETGRKPAGSYGRVNQYTARAGRQTYMSGDTFGLKYLVVRVKSGRVRLEGVKIVDRVYPFDVVGKFACSDPMLERVWRNGVDTVCQCSEDAYVDCAVRERTEWMADGYVQAYHVTRVALAGPAGADGRPRYGDPRLLRSLLRHIGQSAQPDGRVKVHHPSDRWDIHGYIEDYACLWTQAIREYYDYTGDAKLAAELWPAVAGQVNWVLDRRTERGLVLARGFVYPGSNPLCYKVCEGATLNAYVVGALRDAAFLAGLLGHDQQQRQYAAAADALAHAVDRHLWDKASGTYYGGILDGKTHPPTVPAAMMCLHYDVPGPDRRERVRRWLEAHARQYAAAPYAYQFLLGELYRADTDRADQRALDLVRQRWAKMADSETGTVWEGFGPSENCHESGSVPTYLLSAFVLGVRVERPASKNRIVVEPRLADLARASGVVVTDFGPVSVSWERSKDQKLLKFELTVPEGVTATVSLPAGGGEAALTVDGRRLQLGQDRAGPAPKRSGRHITFTLRSGKHAGSLVQ